ncbi:hypothetical protein AWM69_22060 [Pseudomonas sp. D1HM]|nr:hypothetical protein [Pseudomonas sp. D1HM]
MNRFQQQSTDFECLKIFCLSEKAAHHTSSLGVWLLWMACAAMFCNAEVTGILRASFRGYS